MRHLASLIIAVGAVLSAGQAAAQQSLRVQAWNLFQCFGTDDVCDRARQAATMVQSQPDIILTSEIIDDDISFYISELNRLTGHTWHSHFVPICPRTTPWNCDGGGGQGQAIFSRFAPSSRDHKFFSGQDRSAVAMIFDNINGRRIAVVSTHLAANGWDQQPPGSGIRAADNSNLRVSAMAEMNQWAATLAPHRIIGGDFNFNPTQTYQGTTEISRMTNAGYIDSWQKALEASAAFSYPDNPPSMETRTRRSRIDYIFYSGAGLHAARSEIRDIRDLSNTNVIHRVNNSDDNGVRPSDHNMVETVISVSAAGADMTPPTVAITAPLEGATVSGPTTVKANASDDVGVAGVQFTLNGQNLGTEDTAFPYETSWNPTTNGSYVLKAIARDAAGNIGMSTPVNVTVNISAGPAVVGHWKLDDGSGTRAADSSVNGVHGTLIGNPTWVTNGRVGGALSFNGTTDLVSIPSHPSWKTVSSKYTVAFWVKVEQIKDYAGVVAVGNWGTRDLEIMTTSNQWMFRINTVGGTNGWACEGASRPLEYLRTADGNFHHVAVVLDATASRCFLYSDGVLEATDEYVDGMTSFGSQSLNLGGFGDANRLRSVIDDVRLYNTALTPAEVQALAEAAPDTTPPTVAITAPLEGATVSGPTTVKANASDDVGVVGVQFTLNGQNLGTEDTAFPYETSWNPTTNGSYVLKAIARDAAGNIGMSTPVNVTVNISAGPAVVGHWKLDDGSGTRAADSSVNGVHGTLIGNPTWVTNGRVGGALSFNGTTDLVSIPSDPSWKTVSSKYTVAFWVKVEQIKDYAGVVAVGNWGTRDLEIMTTSNQWMFRINTVGGTNGWACEGASRPLEYLRTADGNFHHVAVVLDATASRCFLYSDGVLEATDEYVDGMTSFGSQSLNLGGFGDANRLRSVIDDVRLYNTALTPAEVQALAAGGGG